MSRNRITKILATALVVAATFSLGGNVVQAATLNESGIETLSNSLKNGEYEVENTTVYDGSDTGKNMIRGAIETTSKIVYVDGDVEVTTYFTESMYSYMSNITLKVNGTELKVNENKEQRSITYKLPSIDTEVEMSMYITPMFRTVSFSLNNDMNTLNLVNEYKEAIQNGKYTIKNNVLYKGDGNAETGNASARKTLKEVTNLSVENGTYALTLNFNESSFPMIGEINVKVDNEVVQTTIDREKATVTFNMNSLDSKIEVSVFITMMNRFTDFETILLQDTLEKLSDTTGGNTDDSNGETTGPSTGGNTGGTTTEKEEEIVIVKGKLYTIKNTVTHENATGQAMARQYLNEVSSIEEIDGKYYLTLTFTGMEYMNNHKFYINGSQVSARATVVDSKTTKYRFQIPSLDSVIMVSTYVEPMGRDVEFDVTLQKNTLTFVKEFTVETLPQTGGPISSTALLSMGTLLTGVGLFKRKRAE